MTSPKAVLLATVSRINSEDEASRGDRIKALKDKVESGDYLNTVSSDKVAKKVSDYLFDRA